MPQIERMPDHGHLPVRMGCGPQFLIKIDEPDAPKSSAQILDSTLANSNFVATVGGATLEVVSEMSGTSATPNALPYLSMAEPMGVAGDIR
ncbi:hypothetical protein AB0J82_38380 [Asanoa sp. NPDC049518]|uniref:hypothetical protein n=1 Tax=unclassified Asanoa TaxID=2685164 RepID=UPI0034182775